VICFSFGKGQTGEGEMLRHAGELYQRGCRGSRYGADGEDRRANEELAGAGVRAEDQCCPPGATVTWS